jgi:hypothetical protein
MLDEATRRRLQRLRFLLEEALARAQEQTEAGRHTSLVLLDGACEYAMGLALGSLGEPSERLSFPERLKRLRAHLAGWQPSGWTGVAQLHAARNHAQHRGTLSDSAETPGWAADVERFVSSLVAETFGVELNDVLVADSVVNEPVRAQLVEAERAIAGGDAAAGFSAAAEAFDEARTAWRGQRGEAIGRLLLYGSKFGIGESQHDPVNSALMRIEDVAEVQPFAPDIAEYFWFAVRRAELAEGIEVDVDDAQRAFLFVVAWVLRWEAFTSRYRERRYPSPPPPYEPPTTGASEPHVWNASVEEVVHVGDVFAGATLESARYHVRLQLADIPADERAAWAEEASKALDEIVTASAAGRASGGSVDTDGMARVFSVTADVDGAIITDWVEQAIRRAGDRHRDRLERAREIDSRLESIRERCAGALGGILCRGQSFVTSVTVERQGDAIQVGAVLDAGTSDPIFGLVLDQVVSELRSGQAGIDYHSRTVWLNETTSPAEAARFVRQLATEYGSRADERERGLAAVADRRQAIENELRNGRHGRASSDGGQQQAKGEAGSARRPGVA